jgi:hypothetical protein
MPCPFLKSYPHVLVMQSGQDGNGDDYASWLVGAAPLPVLRLQRKLRIVRRVREFGRDFVVQFSIGPAVPR